MDPHAVLGLARDASAAEVQEAYRREVKRWHPDRGTGEPGARRMRLVNEAYGRLRGPEATTRTGPGPPEAAEHPGPTDRRADPARAGLGAELVRELDDDEPVEVCVPAATWASPQTLLVLTDRRLLWLLDDAPVGRVRSLPLPAVAGARVRRRGPLRRSAGLDVRDRAGRRTVFTGLPETTARDLARRLAPAEAGA